MSFSYRRLGVLAVVALLLVVSLPVIADLSLSPSPALAAEGSFEVLIDDDDDSHAPRVREFAGATRYETSLAAAKRFIDTAHALGTPVSTAVVASGESLIDAAASAGLARAVNGPVLLTQPGEIFIPAAHLIEAAGITRVIIVGGEAAVSAQVFAALRAVPGVQSVERIGGRNRFDTAALIAKEANSQENYCNSGQRAAVLVAGDSSSFADVTVAGPMSYAMGIPVLLFTTSGEVPTETSAAFRDLGIEHAVVVGGSYSIANLEALQNELRAAGAVTVTHLEGANQFATSVRVLEALKECLGSAFSDDSVALISDTALPDGVSAAPMLGQGLNRDSKVTPILLVGSTNFPVEVKDYLSSTSSAISLTTIGGENAVSNDVARAAVAAANDGNSVIPDSDDSTESDVADPGTSPGTSSGGSTGSGIADPGTSSGGSTGSGIADPGDSTENACRLVGFNAPGHSYLGDITHGFDQHVHDVVSAGFPLPTFAAPSKGTLRVAVLFMDFPDAVATHTTHEEEESVESGSLAYIERYLESESYSQLDVQFEVLDGWLRAPNSLQDYTEILPSGTETLLPSLLAREALALAPPEFDFSDIDITMIVAPSTHFSGGIASPEFSIINSMHLGDIRRPIRPWGRLAAHELMHNLGLTDLYPYDKFKTMKPDNFDLTFFGLMGLQGYVPTDTFPPGHYWRHDMLAWSRWQVDWLREDQVACLTESTFDETITLSPISDPAATAMIVIPIDKSSGIVIESRREIDYLGRTDGGDGILIYEVDASRDKGELPLTLWSADPSNRLILSEYPFLVADSGTTSHTLSDTTSGTLSDGSQLRISIESDDGDFHVVRVVRS